MNRSFDKKKYLVGDKLKDHRDGGIIEILETTEDGYSISVDDIYWDYGCTKAYLDENCELIND